MSSSRSRDSIKNITKRCWTWGRTGTPFLRPRPKPAAGPRAVPELDGPGGSGWGDSTSPSPAHPHAVAEDGTAGRPGGVSRPLWKDRGGMWVAPDELASAPHSTAVRGGAVGGAAAASSEPPGLRRPEASHPPAGRLEPRATSPALPIAGAGGKRPALRDGSPAPGRVPQMAVGRRKRRRFPPASITHKRTAWWNDFIVRWKQWFRDKVLVLLPTSSSKLLAKWQGPFEVTRRVGDLNYEVVRTDRSGARQIYHLNLLKKWNEVEPVMLATAVSGEDDLGPEVITKIQSLTLAPGGDHLSPSQLTDVARLQKDFADVFSPWPGRTNLIQHHIETEPGVVVRSRPYRLPEHKKKVVQSELEAMLEMGVIEKSHSDWASPIVLVPKTDGSVRFCVDYRKVNAVSKFDAYPMPRVDELFDRLGTARFYSTLDLTKGYWQIPLSPLSKEKSAFTTPFGLHQFVTLPFGLFGAPATFQRLMDKILRPHTAYGAPAGGAESAEGSGANGQPKEVCDWAGGGSLSGVPLGSRARDPRPKRRWGSSWGWRGITGGLFLTIRSSPARWLTSLKRRSQIRSRGRSDASRFSPK